MDSAESPIESRIAPYAFVLCIPIRFLKRPDHDLVNPLAEIVLRHFFPETGHDVGHDQCATAPTHQDDSPSPASIRRAHSLPSISVTLSSRRSMTVSYQPASSRGSQA